jgi:hypothetical protein
MDSVMNDMIQGELDLSMLMMEMIIDDDIDLYASLIFMLHS